ncbi:MAG: alanyl-tRNA editing protein [Candidatus Micrarchaeia archaeon]
MTKLLYMDDSYLKQCEAIVEEVDNCKIILNQTIFYPQGGGVPCDIGKIIRGNEEFIVIKVMKEEGKVIHYVDREGLKKEDSINCILDWDRRYLLMSYHTAAHVLAGTLNTDTGALITGNQIELDKTRFDFDLENFDRSILENQVEKVNSYFGSDIPVSIFYMLREEALKIPGMVKLTSVLPPEVNELRIVKIGEIDTQADGGCHVKNLKEIPKIEIIELKNKGKNNRRVYFKFKK